VSSTLNVLSFHSTRDHGPNGASRAIIFIVVSARESTRSGRFACGVTMHLTSTPVADGRLIVFPCVSVTVSSTNTITTCGAAESSNDMCCAPRLSRHEGYAGAGRSEAIDRRFGPRFDRPCFVQAEKESSPDAVTLTPNSPTYVGRRRPHGNSSNRWRIRNELHARSAISTRAADDESHFLRSPDRVRGRSPE
jgi:hypothetical protein